MTTTLNPQMEAEGRRLGLLSSVRPVKAAAWRTLGWLISRVSITPGDYELSGHVARPRFDLVADGTPPGAVIVEVELLDGVGRSVEEAHVLGKDLLELFADRVALVGYCPVDVHMLGTTPITVKLGEAFPLAIPAGVSGISIEPITPAALRPIDSAGSYVQVAIHNFRRALSSTDEELRVQRLHSALEVIAQNETTERVREQCPNCRHEWEKHRATGRFIKNILESRPVSSDVADKFTKMRGKIAHGNQLRELAHLAEALEVAGGVESAVASELAERADVMIARRCSVAVGISLALHYAVGTPDGAFCLLQSSVFLPMRFTKVDDSVSKNAGTARAGAPFSPENQPEIDPAIWPKIEGN